ncbi:hypothetical protein [Olsenella sp. Marseille-P4559]|uniref:hypothetical protein n=1 Tax=Olsenella sp. Marseille-P4559 TaxID=2364795 RepID=UPI00102FF5E8|nr:hypothetical protein [Olsenella sp. Marseille-P4559]
MAGKKRPRCRGCLENKRDSREADGKDAATTSHDRTVQDARSAYRWIEDNRPAYACGFCAALDADVKAGRKASPYRAAENMRAKRYVDSSGDTTQLPNALIPCLVRIYLADHPEAAPFVETARSRFDGVSLHGVAAFLDGRCAHAELC